ncbi:MAG: PQQ-dependent sugar dehydrogenase [Chloroflexota bacterium]
MTRTRPSRSALALAVAVTSVPLALAAALPAVAASSTPPPVPLQASAPPATPAPASGSASAAPRAEASTAPDLGSVRIALEPFASGLDAPVFVTGDRSESGWLYAVEQPGRIVAISPDGEVATVPVLDIRDRVVSGGEQGLLGLALHPDFRQNGRLFVDYTRAEDGATVVSELAVGADGIADPASERVLLTIAQPYPNHNGGMLAFDADGNLLIGMGDGGGGGDPDGNGQDRSSLLGKILRIGVDGDKPYEIPEDNPFLRDVDTRPEILALGVRNPWRFSVDRATGDVWIGDVGQGDWEEVDVLPAGQWGENLGWNVMEGDVCYGASSCGQAGLQLPVATIGHDAGACSVIGGDVYRGSAIPALAGGYIYTDLCIGTLWGLDAAAAVAGRPVTPFVLGEAGGQPVAFGQADDGELLLVDHGGTIARIVAAPGG